MRPSIGVIDYSSPGFSLEQHLKVLERVNLTVLAATSEGKVIYQNDTTVYVMIPVYLKGQDKKIWMEGKGVEFDSFYKHKLDEFASSTVTIIER